jgi:hypothetical protein
MDVRIALDRRLTDVSTLGGQRRDQGRDGVSWVKPRGERVEYHKARRALDQITETGGLRHLPKIAPLPKLCRRCRTSARQLHRVRVDQGLHAARPRVTGIAPGDLGNLRPKRLSHLKAFELQRLLGVPRLRHMRGQRTDHTARGPCPRAMRIDQCHLRPTPRAGPCHRQAEDACAMDDDVHCNSRKVG